MNAQQKICSATVIIFCVRAIKRESNVCFSCSSCTNTCRTNVNTRFKSLFYKKSNKSVKDWTSINSFDDDGGIPRSGLCCWCGIPREDPRNLICLNTTTHWGGHSTSSTLSTAARKKIKKEMTSRAERQNEDQEYQGWISATDHLTNVIE